MIDHPKFGKTAYADSVDWLRVLYDSPIWRKGKSEPVQCDGPGCTYMIKYTTATTCFECAQRRATCPKCGKGMSHYARACRGCIGYPTKVGEKLQQQVSE